MSHRPLITVFGAAGAEGGGVVRALLASADRPFRVRAVTCSPGCDAAQSLAELGAEICAAGLDDPAGVERALKGAHGAYGVAGDGAHLSPEHARRQAGQLAEAARRADVRHVIWSAPHGRRRADERDGRAMPLPHGGGDVFDTGSRAGDLDTRRGLPLTRLLTAFRWDDLVRFGLRRQRGGGLALVLPIGAARLPGIAAADIGACAAALFRQAEEAIGRCIGIAAEHLGGARMAEGLSRAVGEPVRFVAADVEEYARSGFAHAAGLAEPFRGTRDFDDDDVCVARDVAAARALHPALMRFDEFVARHAEPLRIELRAAA